MGTFLIVFAILAIAGLGIYLGMKSGKIEDKNNNNIPDAVEEKVEDVKEVVEKAKKVVKKAEKAIAKTVVVEKKATKKPAVKKTAAKKTK